MDLTTLARVKLAIEKSLTTDDSALSQLISEVSAAAEREMNRAAETKARTEFFDTLTNLVWVQSVPLLGYGDSACVITKVSYDVSWVWPTTSVVDATSYYLDLKTGLLYFRRGFSAGPRALKVEYTGGMEGTAADFVAAYPDIAQAVEQQVVHLWQTRGHLGLQSVNFEGGAISSGQESARWLDYPKRILKFYRRAGLCG